MRRLLAFATRSRLSCPALTFGLALGLWGCAGSGGGGASAFEDGDYSGAVEELTQLEAAQPDDARIQRNLGIALWKSGRAAEAADKLAQAHEKSADDPATLYFLGRAAESADRPALALDAYTAYLAHSNRGAAEVKSRRNAIGLRLATVEVKARLADERKLSVADIPENSLAIPDFTNVVRSDTLEPLSRGLATILTTDLARVRALRVLERRRLQVLLDEVALGRGAPPPPPSETSGLAPVLMVRGQKARLAALPGGGAAPYYQGPIDDEKSAAFLDAVKKFQAAQGLTADGVAGPKTRSALEAAYAAVAPTEELATPMQAARLEPSTAPRAGLLLGARRFVQGSFVPLGEDQIQLDGTILETQGGGVRPTGAPLSGRLEEVLRLEKQLLTQTLSTLGIELSPAERRELERLPTENFLAFLAFSQGITLEDRGDLEGARAAYRQALSLDGGFSIARERLQFITITPEDLGHLDELWIDDVPLGTRDLIDRLIRTGTLVGNGPGPDIDRGDDPSITPAGVLGTVDTDAVIVIGGDLPGGRP